MGRNRVYAIDPRSGREVPGVSKHPRRGYYIRKPESTSSDNREWFGRSVSGLDRAIKRLSEIACPPRISRPMTDDEAIDELLATGMDLEDIEGRPELIQAAKTGKRIINPEWSESNPDHPFRRMLDRIRENQRREGKGMNPLPAKSADETVGGKNNKTLTIIQIGEKYRQWYLSEHVDLASVKAQADAVNQQVREHNAEVSKRLAKRKREGKPEVTTKSLRRKKLVSWTKYMPKKVRTRYKEHKKYYGEFAKFVGETLEASKLTDATFQQYYEHVRNVARNKSNLTNPERWCNHRFESVKVAFRRVKKRYPSVEWAPGLFGEDGMLSILEQKDTVSESQKILITPSEFRAMLSVADVQWKAILHLTMNVALSNQDVSDIEWKHIDLDKRIMFFPRGKTKRIRQTPLVDVTVDALKTWQDESKRTTGNVFLTWQGTIWVDETDSVGKHWDLLRSNLATKNMNVDATFRSLRKTASSTVMASNIADKELAVEMLLGHVPKKSWRHYVGFAPDFLHDAVQAIEQAYFPGKS